MKSHELREQQIAEEATGCCQSRSGLGTMYIKGCNGGEAVTEAQAAEEFQNGKAVEIPNAGAGSFRRVFEALGMTDVEVFEWMSSAGDWTFGVQWDGCWYPAWQNNRYPYHGFRYGVDVRHMFSTKDELFDWMNSQF